MELESTIICTMSARDDCELLSRLFTNAIAKTDFKQLSAIANKNQGKHLSSMLLKKWDIQQLTPKSTKATLNQSTVTLYFFSGNFDLEYVIRSIAEFITLLFSGSTASVTLYIDGELESEFTYKDGLVESLPYAEEGTENEGDWFPTPYYKLPTEIEDLNLQVMMDDLYKIIVDNTRIDFTKVKQSLDITGGELFTSGTVEYGLEHRIILSSLPISINLELGIYIALSKVNGSTDQKIIYTPTGGYGYSYEINGLNSNWELISSLGFGTTLESVYQKIYLKPSESEFYQKESHSLSDLLELNGVELSANKVNKILLQAGILTEKIRPSSKDSSKFKKYKVLSKKGEKFGFNKRTKGQNTKTKPRYFEQHFDELLNQYILDI